MSAGVALARRFGVSCKTSASTFWTPEGDGRACGPISAIGCQRPGLAENSNVRRLAVNTPSWPASVDQGLAATLVIVDKLPISLGSAIASQLIVLIVELSHAAPARRTCTGAGAPGR